MQNTVSDRHRSVGRPGDPLIMTGFGKKTAAGLSLKLLTASLVLFLFICSGRAENNLPQTEELSEEVVMLREEVAKLKGELENTRVRVNQLQCLLGMDRYRFPDDVELFGQKLPLDRSDLWERMDREFLIAVHDIPQVLLWIKRANRYFPMIQRKIREAGLPDDLKYVAIVESDLRPNARSRMGAMGIWQFMPGTGAKYGLLKNRWVDERLDPVKSTDAAITYLKDLYAMFGDWILSVASYNVGENKVKREIEWQKADTFYDLVLPDETERYIFRIAAAKVILADPGGYGFELGPDDLYDPPNVARMNVNVDEGRLDLIALANGIGLPFRHLKELNEHFKGSSVFKGNYAMYVPSDKTEDVKRFIETWKKDPARHESGEKITHRVRNGETLWEIARKYRVNVKSIQEWNKLGSNSRILSGQKLTIYMN